MTDISSESDTSSLHHAEIYCDEFLGTSVVYRDREIFLEAACQLIETNSCIKHSLGFPFTRRYDTVAKSISSPISATNQNRDKASLGTTKVHEVKADLIRFGKLDKSTDRSTQLQPKWKKKLVEVKFGMFIYEDDLESGSSGPSTYGLLSSTNSANASNANKKFIVLSTDTCTCKARRKKGSKEDFVFELVVSSPDGKPKKRLFRASSAKDLDAWIESITAAMMLKQPKGIKFRRRTFRTDSPINSKQGSNIDWVVSENANVMPSSSSKGVLTGRRRASTGYGDSPQNATKSSSSKRVSAIMPHSLITPELLYSSETSLPGPAALHADNVALFCGVRNSLAKASLENYESIVRRLATDHVEVRIPVFFVKSAFHNSSGGSASNFIAAADDMTLDTSISPSGTVLSGQVYKDFQRDSVNLNGRMLYGQKDGGALGVLTALREAILLQARCIIEQENDRMEGETIHADGIGNNEYRHFTLSDKHAEICAKDILILSNRTQSGGDSYFCVDALLAKCGLESINKEYGRYAVLTPYENESEPLCITVETAACEGDKIGTRHRFEDSIRAFVEGLIARRGSTPGGLRSSRDTSSETEDTKLFGTASALAKQLNKFSFRTNSKTEEHGCSSPLSPPSSAASMINSLREQELASWSADLNLNSNVDESQAIVTDNVRPTTQRPVSFPHRLFRGNPSPEGEVPHVSMLIGDAENEDSQQIMASSAPTTSVNPSIIGGFHRSHSHDGTHHRQATEKKLVGFDDINANEDKDKDSPHPPLHRTNFHHQHHRQMREFSDSSSDYTSLTSSDDESETENKPASPKGLERNSSMYTRNGSPFFEPSPAFDRRSFPLRGNATSVNTKRNRRKSFSATGKSPSFNRRGSVTISPRIQSNDYFASSNGRSPVTVGKYRHSISELGGGGSANSKRSKSPVQRIETQEANQKRTTRDTTTRPTSLGSGGRVDNDGRVRFKLVLDLENEIAESIHKEDAHTRSSTHPDGQEQPLPSKSEFLPPSSTSTQYSESFTMDDLISSSPQPRNSHFSTSRPLADSASASQTDLPHTSHIPHSAHQASSIPNAIASAVQSSHRGRTVSAGHRLESDELATSPHIYRKVYTSDDIINIGDTDLLPRNSNVEIVDQEHLDSHGDDWSDIEIVCDDTSYMHAKSIVVKKNSIAAGSQISNGKHNRRRTLSHEDSVTDTHINTQSASQVGRFNAGDYQDSYPVAQDGPTLDIPNKFKKSKGFLARIRSTIASPFTPNRKPDSKLLSGTSSRGGWTPSWDSSRKIIDQTGSEARSDREDGALSPPTKLSGSPIVDSIAARIGFFGSSRQDSVLGTRSIPGSQIPSLAINNGIGSGASAGAGASGGFGKEFEHDGPCIRVSIRADCKYKLCCADPQGEFSDNWAVIDGVFTQVFYIHSNCKGRASATDRLVTITLVPPIPPRPTQN